MKSKRKREKYPTRKNSPMDKPYWLGFQRDIE